MGWFRKATGMRTPKFMKKLDDNIRSGLNTLSANLFRAGESAMGKSPVQVDVVKEVPEVLFGGVEQSIENIQAPRKKLEEEAARQAARRNMRRRSQTVFGSPLGSSNAATMARSYLTGQ
jgi:hypothetical protein